MSAGVLDRRSYDPQGLGWRGHLVGTPRVDPLFPARTAGVEREMSDPNVWETHAGWWQETFTAGVDDEYEQQMLPLLAEHAADLSCVLDLGTGEGQVARVLSRTASLVVGVDRSRAQIDEAERRGAGPV